MKWAADNKLIEASPAASIEADAPETKPTKKRGGKTEVDAKPAPVEKKAKRKRRGAIVLEVAQPEAADAAEAHIANSTETVA